MTATFIRSYFFLVATTVCQSETPCNSLMVSVSSLPLASHFFLEFSPEISDGTCDQQSHF